MRPSTLSECYAERKAMLTGTDPLARARRRTLLAFGIREADWLANPTLMTPAMHRHENAILKAEAGLLTTGGPEAPVLRLVADTAWDRRGAEYARLCARRRTKGRAVA